MVRAALILYFIQILSIMTFAQEKYTLEYKYGEGTEYKYESESRYTSEQELYGQEMKASGSISSRMILNVTDVSSNGNMTFTSGLEKLTMKVKTPMMDTVMDMNDHTDKPEKATISKFGNILLKEVSDSGKAGDSFQSFGNVNSIFNEMALFPGREVVIGEKWNNEKTDTARGFMMITKTHTDYTFQSVEARNSHTCAKILFTGNMEIAGKMNQMGMDFLIEGSGDTSGTIWFDMTQGVIVAKETKMVQDLTLVLTGQMQLTLPVSQNFVTTTTLVE
jgi:hypothetical protein